MASVKVLSARPAATITPAYQAVLKYLPRIYAWTMLIAIPFGTMGWTINRTGLVLDDWYTWMAVGRGQWFNYDTSRPLGLYQLGLVHLLAGDNLPLVFALHILAHGLAAILLFEVARHLFTRCLGRSSSFVAFVAATIFVLYPSDVSHYWLTPALGTDFTYLEFFSAALLWIVAAKRDKPLIVLVADVLTVVSLLHAESAILLLAALPAMVLFYGRMPWSRRWIGSVGAWYAVLAGYIVWRFKIIGSSWHVAHLGNAPVSIHPVQHLSLLQLVNSIWTSFIALTLDTVHQTLAEYGESLQSGSPLWWIPAGAILAALLIVTGAWLVNRGWQPVESVQNGYRRWLALLICAVLAAIAGMLPYIYNGEQPQAQVLILGILSRYASFAAIGMSVLLALLPLGIPVVSGIFSGSSESMPLTLKRANGRWTLMMAGVLCVFVLSIGIVRQVDAGQDYVAAWQIQRTYWQRFVEQPALWQRGAFIDLYHFPDYVNYAPMANQSWAFSAGQRLLMSPPPQGVRIYDDHTGELSNWKISHGVLSVQWFAYKKPFTVPLKDVVVLTYDTSHSTIKALTTFPPELLPAGTKPVALFTGLNEITPAVAPTDFARSALAPWSQSPVCSTLVPVYTSNVAPYDGVVTAVLTQGRKLIDRRFVSRGTPLHYSFYAPCGQKIRLSYTAQAPKLRFSAAQLVPRHGKATFVSGDRRGSAAYKTVFPKLHRRSPRASGEAKVKHAESAREGR